MRETIKFARIAITCAIGVLFLAGGVARAHHAFAAEFDVNRPIKLRGTVTKMDWINPHSWIHIDVKDADGKVTGWMIEGGSPNSLLRLGFTKEALPEARSSSTGFRPRTDRAGASASRFRSLMGASYFWADRRRARTGTLINNA